MKGKWNSRFWREYVFRHVDDDAISGPEEAVSRLIGGSILEARAGRTGRQANWSVFERWGMLGGDTVAAVQANWLEEGGRRRRALLESCCHNTAAN